MKRLPLFLLLLFALPVHAQCTGSGLVWSCTATSTLAQINAAIGSASDGAVLTLQPGTYISPSRGGGANIQFSPVKGLTIICATPPSAVGSAITNQCLMQGVGPTFGTDNFSGTVTKFYRISGFTIDGGGSKPSLGTIYWDSYNGSKNATLTQIRVDHCTFQNFSNGAQTTLIASGGTTMQVYGVYDHNLYTSPQQISMVIWIGSSNPSSAVAPGTGNNLFFENNTLTFTALGNGSAEGCTDGESSAGYVVRYNTSTNCLWASHGETHGTGMNNFELYNNSINMTDSGATGFQDCFRCFHDQGAGAVLVFGNTLSQVLGFGHNSGPLVVQHYRAIAGAPGGVFTLSQVAINTPSTGFVTFTGTGLTGGSHYYNFANFTNAGNNTYTSCTNPNSTTLQCTLTTQVNETHAGNAYVSSQDGGAPQCDGTVNTGGNLTTPFPDGNRAPTATNQGYPCYNQPGRLTNGNIFPMFAWNNKWADDGSIANFIVSPITGAAVNYFSQHIIVGRDLFNPVSSLANTTPTSPFDGVSGASATGVGFGTLANRPTSCTSNTAENAFGKGVSGVGYFATDVGAQGTLYICSSPNTWTVQYTPYTYPHPLVGGTPQAVAPTFSLANGTYSNAQTTNITTTFGSIICYNTTGSPATNGSTGCAGGSTLYTGPVAISVTEHLFAVAGGTGFTDSPVAVAIYAIGPTLMYPQIFAGNLDLEGTVIVQ